MRRLLSVIPVVLSFVFAVSFASTSDSDWNYEVVDSVGGRFSSMRFDPNGNGHVTYVGGDEQALKYAFWDVKLNRWFTTTIDKTRGFCSLALDSHQRPHISYLAYDGNSQIKYAYWTGSEWKTQPIRIRARDISFYTSITVDSKDLPHITYYEYQGMGDDYRLQLRKVSWTGSTWEVKTVDTDQGSGKFNAVAVDSHDTLHAVYANVKDENQSLRYARSHGTSWDIRILEPKSSGYSVNIAIGKDDTPHLVYTDLRTRTVKYATYLDGRWHIEPVDVLAEVAYPDRNGIALDESGNVYLTYYDAGKGTLTMAARTDGKWHREIVDSGSVGFTSSVQVANGWLWIVYPDEASGVLKCARKPLFKAAGESKPTGAGRTPANANESMSSAIADQHAGSQ